ncbi:CynX/NimT family MFS transporter [Paenibacillus oceani]|uniref:MFS transporter n=1 Tax=Paenibacillus oceani TaxID=2772510 RepID=A0A927CAL6_9BACL|nr:MFS transporter [Paenibacillus oceani]MBD2864509.1 MFS transporter [Paenibacillus oceani]
MRSADNRLKEPPHHQQSSNARVSAAWVIVAAIVCIAVNLRAPLTSVGPLVGLIKDHLHISNTSAGLITTVPLLAFALFSPFVPRLGHKIGVELLIFLSILGLTAGITLRSLSGVAALFIGTAVLGLAISVCNVLLPSLIKREFPKRIGLMTGMYSISMNLFGAIASGISVPVAVGLGLGWQGALGVWGLLSIVSLICWLPYMKRRRHAGSAAVSNQSDGGAVNVWRSALAWQVTLFMGLQSTLFYVLIAWLPELLVQQGVSANQSGWYLSIMQLALLPFTFIVPIVAGRLSSQRSLVIIMAILLISGTSGLLAGNPGWMVVWIVVLGIGGGFAFGLSMMFFGLRTQNARQAAALSGMAQSVGYLLAAGGPTLFGLLHDITNGWKVPLVTLVGIAVLLGGFGLGAARDRYVGSA